MFCQTVAYTIFMWNIDIGTVYTSTETYVAYTQPLKLTVQGSTEIHLAYVAIHDYTFEFLGPLVFMHNISLLWVSK